MKLVIASNNQHKIREISNILAPYFDDIVSMKEMGIEIEVVEDGQTFEENALKKAREIQAYLPTMAVLADDSGIEVDALDGAPGIYSARYAGDGHDDEANNKKLLKALKGVPREKRTARFVCAIALCGPNFFEQCVLGICEGFVLENLQGNNGFGYDPLFEVCGVGKTFGELTEKAKAKMSHRAKALQTMRQALIEEKTKK